MKACTTGGREEERGGEGRREDMKQRQIRTLRRGWTEQRSERKRDMEGKEEERKVEQ